MLSVSALTIILYSIATLSAHLPDLTRIKNSFVSPSSASPYPLTTSNGSTAPSNISLPSNHKVKIFCNRQYGLNPKVKSCRDLFGYIRPDDEQSTFSARDSGIPSDAPLPLRTYSNDAVCFLEPTLQAGVAVGHASTTQLLQAGVQILQSCVIERGMGGLAYDIGGDNKVEVRLAKYEPNIKCDTGPKVGPPFKSCLALSSHMRANDKFRVFGSYDQPGIGEGLPYELETDDGKCVLTINIVGHTSTISSWYEIWAATSALASVCTRWKEKGGKLRGLGANQNIYLELSDKATSPPSIGRVSNITSVEPVAGLLALDGPAVEA